jgi:hypothetical protein
VPITELQCPRCGATVEVGLPLDATVKSVSVADEPETDGDGLKARSQGCRNGHEFVVVFEW